MTRAHTESIVQELCTEMGLADLALDETDRLSLMFGDLHVTLAFTEQPLGLLFLYVDIGARPSCGCAGAEFLLELNLQLWVRNSLTIGLDHSGARVIGMQVVPAARLDLPLLRDTLQEVLEMARGIRPELCRCDLADREGEAPPDPEPVRDPNMIRV